MSHNAPEVPVPAQKAARRVFPTRPKTHASRSESIEQVARLFQILTFLREQRGARVRRADIAPIVDLSPRHLQRYLNVLKASELIRHDKNGNTYLLEERGVQFSGISLTAEDVLALGLARALLGGPHVPEGSRIRVALDKVGGGAAVAPLHSLFQNVARSLTPLAPARDYSQTPFAVLAEAAAQHRQITMDYESRSGNERSWRTIDPYALELRDGRLWEMHAWCYRNQAFRTFALDAVYAARPTGETFARRDDAWAAFRNQTGVFGGMRGGPTIAVRVHFASTVATYALRHRWPPGLTVTPAADGGAYLTGEAQGTDGIVPLLLSWRRYAYVEGGPELQTAMREEVTALHTLYKKDDEDLSG